MTDPLTGTTQYAYDLAGNTTVITSAGTLAVEVRAYDAQNRVISDTAEGPLGAAGPVSTTLLAYDSEGNVTESQAPNGDVTVNLYDGINRLTETDLFPVANTGSNPSQVVQTWGYDDVGNLLLSTDGDSLSFIGV